MNIYNVYIYISYVPKFSSMFLVLVFMSVNFLFKHVLLQFEYKIQTFVNPLIRIKIARFCNDFFFSPQSMTDLQKQMSSLHSGETERGEREINAAKQRQAAIEDLERGVSRWEKALFICISAQWGHFE